MHWRTLPDQSFFTTIAASSLSLIQLHRIKSCRVFKHKKASKKARLFLPTLDDFMVILESKTSELPWPSLAGAAHNNKKEHSCIRKFFFGIRKLLAALHSVYSLHFQIFIFHVFIFNISFKLISRKKSPEKSYREKIS